MTDFRTSFEPGEPMPPQTGAHEGDGATLTVRRGDGPTASPTARAGAGFTGMHALEYVARHRGDGPGRAAVTLAEVDLPVGPATELSYHLLPELPAGDLGYRATYVGIDLEFADGSRLGELAARDHHGVPAHARAQGESKALSVDQWNRKSVQVGAVAAGRVVRRVLLTYDHPAGPGEARGWLDDVALVTDPRRAAYATPVDYVLTTRGTHATSAFSRGNTIPATAVPHGFHFLVPATDAGTLTWLYDYHRGNDEANRPRLQALSISHQPSPWMGDRQTFQLFPVAWSPASGPPDGDRAARSLPFGHESETARPHEYAVTFDNGVRVRMAPTDHAAIVTFGFPEAVDAAAVVFDNVTDEGGLAVDVDGGVVTGYSDVASRLSVGSSRMFVHATVDRPLTAGGVGLVAERPHTSGWVGGPLGTDRTVTVRLATSFLGAEQARRNLELELAPDDTVDTVAARAKARWEAALGVVEVEGASEDQLRTLYGNLYRLFLYPNVGHENVGTAERPRWRHASPVADPVGPHTPTHTGARVVDGEMYVNNGFWDTYRTTWPAYALLAPDRAGRMIDGFLQQYREGGWVSRWSSPGYADLMVGTSSDVAFADAFVKGVTGFDLADAYDAALRNAMVAPPHPGVGRKGLDETVFRGYVTTDTPEGLCWALEGCVNDFALAVMSRELADRAERAAHAGAPADPRLREYRDNAAYFAARCGSWVHLFDADTGFFRGRRPDGAWAVPAEEFDPREWGGDYTETNAWTMAFAVPHDGAGLAAAHGGREALAARLDAYFSTVETGLHHGHYRQVIHEMTEARDVRMGQYGHSNQPAHHIPYLYAHAGRPDRTQELVREVLARLYLGSEIGQGYPGDEDNGEMSAWWLFSALGFYPLTLGTPGYVVGSPLFTKATVHLPGGASLVVRAPDNSPDNVYVQGLRLDGEDWPSTYLPHDRLAAGATVEFAMGPEPSAWGAAVGQEPPSASPAGTVPSPPHDLTGDGSATTAAADLVDDTSATAAWVAGPDPTFEVRLARTRAADLYTLTSAPDSGGDPTGWVLEGAADDGRWTAVDSREGEVFRWRRQTRAFAVAAPAAYASYRLRFTGASPDGVRLAQVQLFPRR